METNVAEGKMTQISWGRRCWGEPSANRHKKNKNISKIDWKKYIRYYYYHHCTIHYNQCYCTDVIKIKGNFCIRVWGHLCVHQPWQWWTTRHSL